MSTLKIPTWDELNADPERWVEVQPPVANAAGRSFVSGEPDGDRIRIRYFQDRENDHAFLARVWLGPGAEGPPFHAHGGCTAAVLDEAMGTAAWCSGHPVVAATLSMAYKNMTPLGQVHDVFMHVKEVDGKKVQTTAQLTGADGTVFVEGKALFVSIGIDRLSSVVKNATFPG